MDCDKDKKKKAKMPMKDISNVKPPDFRPKLPKGKFRGPKAG